MRTRILCLMVGMVAACMAGAQAAEIRYDDVLYLDELNQAPLQLKVLQRTPITFSRDSRSEFAHVSQGQTVTVVGVGEGMYYVSTRIVTGPARGWVVADALEAPPAQLLETLRKRHERIVANRALIAHHEVALGMTPEEVRASLGKPERRTRNRTQEGEEEQWMYLTYRYLPYYTNYYDDKGVLRQLVYYRRVPAGHKVISFHGGEVVATTDEENRGERAPEAVVVPVPPQVGN
jgi:hypothetical protein